MKSLKMIVVATLLGMTAGCGNKESAPDINVETLKQGISDRLSLRAQAITDYSCDLESKLTMRSEGSDRSSEMSLKLTMKNTGESKLEFIKGHRGGFELTKKDYEQLERRKHNPESRGADQSGEETQVFEFKKYLPDMKLISAEKLDKTKTYKLEIEPLKTADKFKKITLWVDTVNFDVIKIIAEMHTRSANDVSEVVEYYSPIGPNNLTMKVALQSRTVRSFETPRGKMTMDLTAKKSYSNYTFNQGFAVDFFEKPAR
ncbi:MAG: hypothetical protein ACOY90_02035 [Candidatus Zhuqueibacterota bacterium]